MAVPTNSEYKRSAVAQIIGRLIGSELIGFCFALFYVVAKKPLGILANVVFGFCTLGCTLCLFADYCLKLGGKMKGNVTLHKEKPEPYFGAVLGIIASVPFYISYIVLVLSKAGVIGSFTGYFKLINSQFFPIIDLFAKSSTATADISAGTMIFIALLPAAFIVTCHISYKITYNNIDVAQKLLYKKNNM